MTWKEETGKITFSNKFADDAKLRSMVDKLEGKVATSTGLDRLEKWAESSLAKLNKCCPRTERSRAQNVWAWTGQKVALQKGTQVSWWTGSK